MKWIWSIGNKINDGHKALAVLTLNNLSFDASLLLLHDAPSVFTTLCSNSWGVGMKWQPFFSSSEKSAHPTQRFSLNTTYFQLYMYVLLMTGEQVDPWAAQREVLFNSVDGDVQPVVRVCPAVAWKVAESFTLQLPAHFQTYFFLWNDPRVCTFEHRILGAQKQSWVAGNIPCQRVMADGEWSCPRDQSDGGRHPPCCPSSPSPSRSCCPVILHMALTGCIYLLETFQQNNLSLTVTQMNLLAVRTAD